MFSTRTPSTGRWPRTPTRPSPCSCTYAAIDLAFSDGTYLSDLRAKDHHGFALSPRGQGEAKGLSTNQWNNVEADLGRVAAGKTIKRILIGYDKPTGPADFRGWVDDIRIAAAVNPDAAAARTAAKHPSDLALTTRGTNATGGFSRGNNFPATAVPHGFNFWTPVTNAGSRPGCTTTPRATTPTTSRRSRRSRSVTSRARGWVTGRPSR